MQITFYYDIGCPLSYLAAVRVNALAERAGKPFVWQPVSAQLLRANNRCTSVAKEHYAENEVYRLAEFYGLTLRVPSEQARANCDAAMRLCQTVFGEQRVALTLALFEAFYVQGRDIADRDTLATICKEQALDPALALRALDRDDIKDAAQKSTAQAQSDGVFDVPSVVLTEASQKTLFWGLERLRLVGRMLGLRDDIVVRSRFVEKKDPEVATFYYDIVSPYAYLAASQIENLAARQGAKVAWKPIFLGGLFRSLGLGDATPLEMATQAKQAYVRRDMGDWADFYGLPWRFPEPFPVNTVTALRLVLAVDAPQAAPLSLALFRAYWRQGRNVSDLTVLRDVAKQVGIADATVERACDRDPALKQKLIDATHAAQKDGVFGAPTFRVRNHLFWGQDRLPMVERALAGWNPRVA